MYLKAVFNRAVSAVVRTWRRDFGSKLFIVYAVYFAGTTLWCTSIAAVGHWRYSTIELEREEPRVRVPLARVKEAWASMRGKGTTEDAIELLLPLAEAGDPEAQYRLGYILYWYGDLADGRLECEAMRWFDRAARGGHPYGQYMLASAYLGGDDGFYENAGKSYRWALAAARNGVTHDWALRFAVEDLTAAERQAIERDMETWRPEDEPPALIICIPDFLMGGRSLIGPRPSYSFF